MVTHDDTADPSDVCHHPLVAEVGGMLKKNRNFNGVTCFVKKMTDINMGVSENSGTPQSSILIGFSIINHPFGGITIFGNTHIWPFGLIFKFAHRDLVMVTCPLFTNPTELSHDE